MSRLLSKLGMLPKLIKALLIRNSVRYQNYCVRKYWSSTNTTHASMASDQFDLYASELTKLTRKIAIGCRLLDYGGGNGELALRLTKLGYKVDVAEFSSNFKDAIESNGLVFVDANNLPMHQYEIVLANNCFFYVHPKKITSEIYRLKNSLKENGALFITDVPTLDKIDFLTKSKLMRIFFKFTGIYQPEIGGVFVDGQKMALSFGAKEFDSWCPYRSHFLIKTSIHEN